LSDIKVFNGILLLPSGIITKKENIFRNSTMPIFEYKCNSCGNVYEFLERTANKANNECPKCGSKDMQKLISGFAVGHSSAANQACEGCDSGICSANNGACPCNVSD